MYEAKILFGTSAMMRGRHDSAALRRYAVRKRISSFMNDVNDGVLSISVFFGAPLPFDAAIAL